ncbi:MAG: CDP-diacylglycerol--serine O-phosphatidyltransferase [Acidobacteria bacterium]|uniref:CDP-diacylglycerol--serine O-phosphatidyltransferase n=1 Tax=Candidatus Polarisedimenticola svalbardensis TaxID=2886004 RepID=A0A8J6XZ90_9BACT|nr:CDP-diacylglycerol--serine O-phosphatidyltransferase [Candidatus Polarisedimenticola svalbardensis]
MPNKRFRRGIYLLPSLFTVGNLFCGFASIVQTSLGRFELAAILIIVSGILDGLDGRIARLTGTTSDFGVEFDSLADIVSFGVAPAFLVFSWVLHPLGRAGWLAAFVFVVCAAMRLARFNIRRNTTEKRYFAGLPSPPAAGLAAAVVFAFPEPAGIAWLPLAALPLMVGLAVLMVSRFRYRSFKDLNLQSRQSYINILLIAAVLIGVFMDPQITLLSAGLLYVLSGPALYLWSLPRRFGKRAAGDRSTEGEVADDPVPR